ncbi:MAG: NAD-dependent malic enzyme, mitochondrial [Heterodermia speciosa]|uniref:Malic enzyme n=1 Tax=Heterodermia speciosa TaxID=116794 RepID=A0A8H3IKM1_9LECA|nr:MAG: NAD-dependent malic enzyme, mitochondrial [Heterodermia speciosa]
MSPSPQDVENEKYGRLPLSNSGPEECALTGSMLLRSPYHNKGSAFPANEREDFKLHSLLPPSVQTLDEQVRRAYQQYSSRSDPIAKNTFMTSMKDQNEVLYYKLVQDHLKEMFGIIYTPTEAEAIQHFSRLFRKPEGCFLNIFDMDRIEESLTQWGLADDVDYIVVTDGEEILGIGDQGVGGILISVAKLVITTLCAGIHPARTLPVVLDCGTDNDELLNDELYLGLRRPRVRGKEYDDFVDRFVQAVRKQFPKAYLHFEDFGLSNARRILDRYSSQLACFNDDIQGTGCITLAAIMAGMHVSKLSLKDMRLVIFGSGTAGMGIADQVRDAIAIESGKSPEDSAQQIWCVDKPGLLLQSMGDQLTSGQRPFARNDQDWLDKDHGDLLSVIREVKPHVLIGTSTKPKAFTEEVVKEMAKHVDRPIVLPLSNPTRLHEADPKDINEWTEGRALIATGSPFPPVEYHGQKYEVAECNNSTAFPGIGLGVVLCRARRLSTKMVVAAVQAVAAQSPALKDANQGLVPDVVNVRDISVQIAKAVIKQAVEERLATEKDIPGEDADLEGWVREQMWEPRYRPLIKVEAHGASRLARGEMGIGGVNRRSQ